ncbi:MAG: hypothetical protein AAF191_16870, partial [Verrucomicrobiota bacterium]
MTKNANSSRPKRRRHWTIVGGVLTTLLGLGIWATGAISRSCQDEEFCRHVSQLLSERLQAEVVIAPMRAHSLVFLECPTFTAADFRGRWAIHAENVHFELDPGSIISGRLGFRSVQAEKMELTLGGSRSSQPVVASNDQSSEDKGAAEGLPWWFRSRMGSVTSIPIRLLRTESLHVSGPKVVGKGQPYEIRAEARGIIENGTLDWVLEEGSITLGQGLPWTIDEFRGRVTRRGMEVKTGVLLSPEGAKLFCQSIPAEWGEMRLRMEATDLKFRPDGGDDLEDAFGPVTNTVARIEGTFEANFPHLHRYRFIGDLQINGLKLGSSKIFQLLAGQTGEERLRNPKSETLSAKLEITPDLVRLTRVLFAEEEVVKLDGWMSVMAGSLVGSFDLALPAHLVGRIPGGKPKEFSYPASGWSLARFRVGGKMQDWQEDLSGRLLGQLSPRIPVVAGPRRAKVSEEERSEAKR